MPKYKNREAKIMSEMATPERRFMLSVEGSNVAANLNELTFDPSNEADKLWLEQDSKRHKTKVDSHTLTQEEVKKKQEEDRKAKAEAEKVAKSTSVAPTIAKAALPTIVPTPTHTRTL